MNINNKNLVYWDSTRQHYFQLEFKSENKDNLILTRGKRLFREEVE